MTFPFWCCGTWCGGITCEDWCACDNPTYATINLTVERITSTMDDGTNVKNRLIERLKFINCKITWDPENCVYVPLGGTGNGTWEYDYEYENYEYALGSIYAPNQSPPFNVCPDCKELKLCERTTRHGQDDFGGFEFLIKCDDPCNLPNYEPINARPTLEISWGFHHDQNNVNYNECAYLYGGGNGYVPDNSGLYTQVDFTVWGVPACFNQKSFSCRSFYTPFTTNNPQLAFADICVGSYPTPFECNFEIGPPYPATFYCNGDWNVETCPETICLDTHACYTTYPGGSVTKECNCLSPSYSGQGTRKYTDEGGVQITISIP